MNKFLLRIFLCSTACTFVLQLSAAEPKPSANIYVLKQELSNLQRKGMINYPVSLAKTVVKATLKENISPTFPTFPTIILTINPELSKEYTNFLHAYRYHDKICELREFLGIMSLLATVAIGALHCIASDDGSKFPLELWLLPGVAAIPFLFSITYPEILKRYDTTYNSIKNIKEFELNALQSHTVARHLYIGRGIQPLNLYGWQVTTKNSKAYSYFNLHEDQAKFKWQNDIPPQAQQSPGSVQSPAYNPGPSKNDEDEGEDEGDSPSNQREGQPQGK